MSKLDEIAGQGPVAWAHDQGQRVDVIHDKVKDLLVRAAAPNHRPMGKAEHYTIPLYTTDPEPLVKLIRQLGDALKYQGVVGLNDAADQVMRSALAALAEFDKGEG